MRGCWEELRGEEDQGEPVGEMGGERARVVSGDVSAIFVSGVSVSVSFGILKAESHGWRMRTGSMCHARFTRYTGW